MKANSKAPQAICGVGIKGEISDETAEDFKWAVEHLKFNGFNSLNLQLDSQGGLVSAAMDIGDVMSKVKSGSNAWVPSGSQCSSACVLILAAATSRYTKDDVAQTQGNVGIHRPFEYEVSSLPASYSEYLTRYESVMEDMKSYFRKFGVSPQLVDDVSVIPSSDIKYLTTAELNGYGLGRQSVAYGEYQKATAISLCGREFMGKHDAYYADLSRKYEELCKPLTDVTAFLRCEARYGPHTWRANRPKWLRDGDAACDENYKRQQQGR